MAPDQKFTRKQVSEINPKDRTVFIIDNVVYDATKFLDEHPGGHEVLVNVAGRDGSEDFDDVGHSFDAKELMKKYAVGELVDEEKAPLKKRHVVLDEPSDGADASFMSSWKFPLLLGVLMTLLYSYVFA